VGAFRLELEAAIRGCNEQSEARAAQLLEGGAKQLLQLQDGSAARLEKELEQLSRAAPQSGGQENKGDNLRAKYDQLKAHWRELASILDQSKKAGSCGDLRTPPPPPFTPPPPPLQARLAAATKAQSELERLGALREDVNRRCERVCATASAAIADAATKRDAKIAASSTKSKKRSTSGNSMDMMMRIMLSKKGTAHGSDSD